MAAQAKAPEGEAEDEESSRAKPPARSKWLRLGLFSAAGLVALGGVGAGAYTLLASGKHEPKAETKAKAAAPAAFFDLPEVLVNLSSTGAERTQYLKVKVVLELPDSTIIQQIQPVLPRVMDTFQVFLREMRPSDLEGSAGLFRMREELTRRVNVAIAPSRITAVLFKEIVVQ